MNLTSLLLLSLAATAAERAQPVKSPLSATPERVTRLERAPTRGPASIALSEADREARRKAVLEELDHKLTVGSYAIIQHSVQEWNDEVVEVVARYDDGRRKIRREHGDYAIVDFANLHTLSPETQACCASGPAQICPHDSVYYPTPSATLGVPEGKVMRVFENCAVQVNTGLPEIYAATQLGKSTKCSPQKANVCVGKTALVEGYREGRVYQVDGVIEKVFTEGTVMVRHNGDLTPFEAEAVRVQTAGNESSRAPASVLPAMEPFDARDNVVIQPRGRK